MAAADFILGINAKLYHGAKDSELSAMTEASNVKDLTVSVSAGEADISTRANQGWRATAATLRECELSWTMNWKPGDAFFAAIKTAMLNSTTVCLAALTGEKDEDGSSGPRGNFSITKFDRKESLEEAITVDVTAKLAKYLAWEDIVVAG
ncbi:MAG: phage tail tube protein [Phycisphaerales bacterium]